MFLSRLGDDDSRLQQSKLRSFRRFVLLHGAARSWLWLEIDSPLPATPLLLTALGWTICLALSFYHRTESLAPRLVLPLLLLQGFWTFPFTDNHFFLEGLCLALLCLADRPQATAPDPVLPGLQALVLIVLFQAGLQKVVYGEYFGGEFLAFMVGTGDRFASLFQWILPPNEVARLQSYDPLRTGAGPYRVDSWFFVALSNGVYLAELALPVLLWLKRTRAAASLAAIAFVVAIQAGAREFGFLMLMTNLLLLFPSSDWIRRLLPVCALLYAYALGVMAGWLPGAGWLGPESL